MYRGAVVGALVALGIPLIGHAQNIEGSARLETSNEVLHAQIRAELMRDPRAAELSREEFESLVTGLASEAQAKGVASDYMDAQESFDTSALFPPPSESNAALSALSPSFLIAISFLILIVLSVTLYVVRRRSSVVEIESDLEA